jgi:hypothetical protein
VVGEHLPAREPGPLPERWRELSSIDYASTDAGETVLFGIGGVFVTGIGSLVLGAVLMFIYSRVAPPYFRGETLQRGRQPYEPESRG